MTTNEMESTINGFHTSTLTGLLEALRPGPDGGRVGFRTGTSWQGGGRAVTAVDRYLIDGEPHRHTDREFTIEGDEPRELGAGDTAAAPVELLLHAVSQCVLATTAAYAALQRVRLRGLEATTEGVVDLHGMLGLDEGVRPGVAAVHLRVRVLGDADEATLEELVRQGVRYSPIRDTLESGLAVRTDIDVATP